MDSKAMNYGNKLAYLLLLNLLTIVCSLPLITIGASYTAMHRVLLLIYRDEECYITKDFFKSFKENFKQATIIWFMYLFVILVFIADYYLLLQHVLVLQRFFVYALYVATTIFIFSLTWVFILLSRYENPIRITIKNSFMVAFSNPLHSIMMIVLFIAPVVFWYLIPSMDPVLFLLGLTLPGIVQAILYSKVFDKLEGVEQETP